MYVIMIMNTTLNEKTYLDLILLSSMTCIAPGQANCNEVQHLYIQHSKKPQSNFSLSKYSTSKHSHDRKLYSNTIPKTAIVDKKVNQGCRGTHSLPPCVYLDGAAAEGGVYESPFAPRAG